MRAIGLAILMVSVGGGCTATALERYTLNQSLSITEMRYQQVMNDLAEVAANSGTLPGFALNASGVANLTNTLSIDSATVWDAAVKGFSKEMLTPFAQHNPELQWTLDLAVSEPQLEAFRYACLWVLLGPPPEGSRAMELLREPRLSDINTWITSEGGSPPVPPIGSVPPPPAAGAPPAPAATPPAPPAAASPFAPSPPSAYRVGPASLRAGSDSTSPPASDVVLTSFIAPTAAPLQAAPPRKLNIHLDVARQLAALPPGWLHVSRDHHVPRHAAYKATRGGVTVWVTADGLAGLSQFTLVMLDIATLDPTKLVIPTPRVTVEITEAATPAPAKPYANNPPKDGDKVTEVWDAGQTVVVPDPNCANPADVKPVGTIWLSRPKQFQHLSSATPCIKVGTGTAPATGITPLSARPSQPVSLPPSSVSP